MLSILIPTYNTDITDLVQSICEQAHRTKITFEVIFCEDASYLYVEKNVQLLGNTNVKRLINATNLGRTATRTNLADNSTYSWLLFLDADVALSSKNFIENYVSHLNSSHDIIHGGISYALDDNDDFTLRSTYGIQRETQLAKERCKTSYFIISQNILVKKEAFLKLNIIASNRYGLDNIFSYQILKQGYNVQHIDNPVIHHGLEKNDVFLKKSIQAIETLIYYEEKGLMAQDFTRLQKSYLTLKKNKVVLIFKVIISKSLKYIEKNLMGKKPSLFLFDLYRLHHYITLKENA
ncbi:glycosyltransferase [Dokdonia sp. Asnod1-B02]|uniref:glycosyltransferase n=1 Tax=Dokdonia sp. Asnod1-B02 TaxID=3160573 RepID=UPI00386752A9